MRDVDRNEQDFQISPLVCRAWKTGGTLFSMERSPAIRIGVTGALGLALLGAAGCNEPLFSPRHPRTQYDRYDRVRGRYVEQDIVNEFGEKHPNLVGRLGRND